MAENMNLITGYQGEPHVTASDDGIINAAVFGENAYILNIGEKLRAEIVSNNQIRIFDGAVSVQGRVARVETSNYVDLTIDTGSQGMKRNDLVCVRYEKDAETLAESCNLIVIKGTENASAPTDPEYTEGDIFAGDLIAEFPIYRVKLDSINIAGIEQIAAETDSFDGVISNPNFKNSIIFDGGKQTSVKGLRLKNNADGATPTNAHDAAVIGGAPNSDTAIAIWDYKNNRRALSYMDGPNKLIFGSGDTSIDFQGKFVVKDFLTSLIYEKPEILYATPSRQKALYFEFMNMVYLNLIFTPQTRLSANTAVLGFARLPLIYRPSEMIPLLTISTSGEVVRLRDNGYIDLFVGSEAIPAGSENSIRISGWYYV